MIKLSDSRISEKYNLAFSKDITFEKISTKIGLVEEKYNAALFNKKGASVSFIYTLENPENDVFLEILEIHKGYQNAFGYSIMVDGSNIYNRAYTDFYSAPMYYFVKIDKSHLKNKTSVKIEIISQGDIPFAIDTIYIYNDFYNTANKQNTFKKMWVNLFRGTNPPKSTADDISLYKKYNSFNMGYMIGVPFIQASFNDIKRNADTVVDICSNENIPFSVMPARWWGLTPFSPDGKGGHFCDAQYNQLIYDRFEKEFVLSVPNQWSSTPWPTMHSEHFEQLASEKLEYLADYISKKIASMTINGAITNELKCILEWGSGYWCHKRIDGGDFSQFVIDAAKKDNITLTPGKLDDTQIEWMLDSVAKYNENLSNACINAVGEGITVINNGKITYPSDQLFNNVYSHTTQGELYPAFGDFLPGWFSGVTNNMWPSSEMYEFVNRCHYDYSRSYGKLSCVNLEVTMLNEETFKEYFKFGYEAGMEFITMFNARFGSEPEWISDIDNIEDNGELEPPKYYQNKLDINVLRDYSKDPLENLHIIQKNNVKMTSKPGISPVIGSENGEIIVAIEDANKFENGAKLYLEGFIADEGKIEIYAGTDENSLTKVTDFVMGPRVTWHNPHSANNIPLEGVCGNEKIFVKLVLVGANTSINAIRLDLLWSFKANYTDNTTFTSKEKRIQNMWIQNRIVAKRFLSFYLDKVKNSDSTYQKATDLYNNGEYKNVISLLNRELSISLPASFLTVGESTLERYPITICSDKEVFVKLLKASDDCIELCLTSDITQAITIKTLNNKYRLSQEDGKYILSKDISGDSSFTVNVESSKKIIADGDYECVVKGVNDKNISIESQDKEFGEYAESVGYPLSANCQFFRKKDTDADYKQEKPLSYDMAIVTIKNGEVTKVMAQFGEISGIVSDYQPPNIMGDVHNGFITLENGEVFGFAFDRAYTKLEVDDVKELFKAIPLRTQKTLFKKGMRVEIEYCPYTFNNSLRKIIKIKKI